MKLQKLKSEFIFDCRRQQLSESRIYKYRLTFRICKKLRIDFDNLTNEEIDRFYFYVSDHQKWMPWTKVSYWKLFKKICTFIDEDRSFRRWKMKVPRKEPMVLSWSELRQLITLPRDFEERLIISLLYESGCRLEEFAGIKRESILFDEHGAVLHIDGKTGPRPVRVKWCAQALRYQLSLSTTDPIWSIGPRAIEKLVKHHAKKAGITRRVYPHLLRHTRASHLSRILTDAEMRIYFGWTRDSPMPSWYTHISGGPVDLKMVKIYESVLKEPFHFNIDNLL